MEKLSLNSLLYRKRVDTPEVAVASSSSRVDTVVTSQPSPVILHQQVRPWPCGSWTWRSTSRKWALIICGLDGPAKEGEQDAQAACLKLASDTIKIKNAAGTRISACHCLSPSAGAGIIIRFTDLSERKGWLVNAKHFKGKKFHILQSPFNLASGILNQR